LPSSLDRTSCGSVIHSLWTVNREAVRTTAMLLWGWGGGGYVCYCGRNAHCLLNLSDTHAGVGGGLWVVVIDLVRVEKEGKKEGKKRGAVSD